MKIICVGRNFAAHAAELNNPLPDEPVIFLKPDSALVRGNADVYYPEVSQDVHYECELVVRISREGKYVQPGFALDYIDGVGLGIDFTARDLQQKAKEKGLPWTLAKGFHQSAPVSAFLPPAELPPLDKLQFHLHVNGEVRQQGDTSLMLYPLTYLIPFISRYMTLKKGDLIFTGTPAGVGPVQKGDRLEAWLEGHPLLNFRIR